MQKYFINTLSNTHLSDTFTPVGVYLRVRDRFSESVLLESTDFRSIENCFSFIGIDAIARFEVQNGEIKCLFPNGEKTRQRITSNNDVIASLQNFIQSFSVKNTAFNGFFGHTAYDAVQYLHPCELNASKKQNHLPEIRYSLYRFVIAFNHFKDELTILENILEGQVSQMEGLERLLFSQNFGTYRFQLQGEESSNMSDEEYKILVQKGKKHCQNGDVLQMVMSRQFSQAFLGDDFNVYRSLRSINPSPYLFYFDCGSYRIFGSSPESQLVIKDGKAAISPIAGSYPRSGNDQADQLLAQQLTKESSQNAEHIMLVYLAHTDLAKHCQEVQVQELKEVQFFSHIIHLVSRVVGTLRPDAHSLSVFADTFPAGTLTGSPKQKAIELIDKYENQNRHFYGGAIGHIGFNGNMNQAIVIRSFLSLNGVLYSQAGANIVAQSDEQEALAAVNQRLEALKRALTEAEKI